MNFQITTTAYSKLSYTPCYKLVCGYSGDVNCSSVKRLAVMMVTRFDSVFIHKLLITVGCMKRNLTTNFDINHRTIIGYVLYTLLYAVRIYSRNVDTRDKPFCFIFCG